MNDYAGLREALAAGPTPGEWEWDGNVHDYDPEQEAPWLINNEMTAVLTGQIHCGRLADAKFIAAANPEVIAALLSERDALKADRDSWERQASDRTDDAVQFARERDKARAERDALSADAERYRWLRHGDNDENVLMTYGEKGSRQFDARFDPCWLPRDQMLDAAIDAARGMGEAGK